MTATEYPTVFRPGALPPVPPPTRRPGGDGRATRPGAATTPVRLTKRGRIIRDLLAGTTVGVGVLFATQINHLLVEATLVFAPLFN